MKKLATFGYVVSAFLPRKFKLISENFKMVSQHCPTNRYREGCCRYRQGEWGYKGRVDNLGESVWCLSGVEVSSAKSKVCDCKKKVSIKKL